MNYRVTVLFFLLFFIGNGTVYSQETLYVTIMPSKPAAVAKGQTTQVAVTLRVKKGFHIQANPAANEFLIPVTLTLQEREGFVLDKPVYPPGRSYRLKGGEKDILTYEDEVTIRVPVTVLDSSSAAKESLIGELNFQPCDDSKCFAPRSVPVVIPVKVVPFQK